MELTHHCHHGNGSINVVQVFHVASHNLKLTMVGGVRSNQLKWVVWENLNERFGCWIQIIRFSLFIFAISDFLTDWGWYELGCYVENRTAFTSVQEVKYRLDTRGGGDSG